MNARFQTVSCSQCGQSFGAGDAGYSHCDQHKAIDELVPVVLSKMTPGEVGSVMCEDADSQLLDDEIRFAFLNGNPELAVRLGKQLMARAMKIPIFRDRAKRELAE